MIIKKLLAAMLTTPVMGKLISFFYKGKIPFRGLRFDTCIPEISPETKAQIFFRIYESAEIRFIQKYLPESLDVIELGSSIGVLSTVIRRMLDKNKRLICVEACPQLSRQIVVNLKQNNLYHNVSCLNKAISYDTEGNNKIYFNPGDLSTTGTIDREAKKKNAVEVETVTLSGLKSDFDIDRYTLVMDIEGEEASIINEDAEALKGCRHLFAELHDSNRDGTLLTVDTILHKLISMHGFELVDRYYNVVYLNKNKNGIGN
ncbi:MAG: FkbM family methyltransferase [Victivallaceae bacterium]|nr:FkbM family methyltransferase [Victivallaceae bacterium]